MSRGLDSWLGVDVGGTNIKWAVLDGETLADSGATPTPQDGERAVVARVAALIAERAGDARGVGITVPGHVDEATGRTGIVPNLPGQWRDFPLRDALARDTGRHLALLNDARAYALAELHLGAATALTDALFLVVGTGVGGAVVLRRELLGGAAGRVGEVGHVSVQPGGPPCGCGNLGCVDAIAGGAGLVAAARAAGIGPTPADVFAAAARGDMAAAEIVDRARTAIAYGVTNACALLGISDVVLGGGLARQYPGLVEVVGRHLARVAPLIGPSTVRLAHFTDHSAAIGAAIGARETHQRLEHP
ncbi:ROK family protein [Phytohabitans sp. LJ34]|uniref:ROK family protein n=1 Tax=Phytohabitans sp. LJ34 TaxID=3452217 RepID=UPI003F892573